MDKTKVKTTVCVHPATIKLLTDATWSFARKTLWGKQIFSKAETEVSKIFIREYYQEIPPEKFTREYFLHFAAYCERIILAKNYVSRFPNRYIPHPCLWLDKRNPKGFTGTKAWYLRNIKQRKQAHPQMPSNPIHVHYHISA